MIYSKRHKVSIAKLSKPVVALNPELEKLKFSISKYLNDLRGMDALDLVASKDPWAIPAYMHVCIHPKPCISNIDYGVVAQEVSTVLPDLLGTQATTAWNMGPDLLTMIKSSSYVRVPDNDRSC